MIDGRPNLVTLPDGGTGPNDFVEEEEEDELDEDVEFVSRPKSYRKVEGVDSGQPGDQYRVTLMLNGKYQCVSWAKLEGSSGPVVDSKYYIAGTWTGWSLVEMLVEEGSPGKHSVTAELTRDGGEFQIVRNQDWKQAYYPFEMGSSRESPVRGPDELGVGLTWCLRGKAGDTFKIDFIRKAKNGVISVQVWWRRLSKNKIYESPSRYFVVGTWDQEVHREEMKWDTSRDCFTLQRDLGEGATESFRILQDGDWCSQLYPSLPDACPHVFHTIKGPNAQGWGRYWTVGKHADDGSLQGAGYEVQLFMKGRTPKKVEWVKVL